MSENPIQPKTMRNVTVELPPEILTDNETGAPIAVGEPRKFSGTLSHHWADLIAEAGDRHE